MVPRLSADSDAVGSYTVCLYQPLSWPHTNQGPYFLHRPPHRSLDFDSAAVDPSSSSSIISTTSSASASAFVQRRVVVVFIIPRLTGGLKPSISGHLSSKGGILGQSKAWWMPEMGLRPFNGVTSRPPGLGCSRVRQEGMASVHVRNRKERGAPSCSRSAVSEGSLASCTLSFFSLPGWELASATPLLHRLPVSACVQSAFFCPPYECAMTTSCFSAA